MSSASSTGKDDSVPPLRKVRLMFWLWLGLALVSLCGLLALLLPIGIRFPAASTPAILGAAFGFYRARRRGITLSAGPLTSGQLLPLQSYTLFWGTLVGAVVYAALAVFRIGIPAPEAPLGWRLLGGLVFGATAGIVAGILAPLVEIVTLLRRHKRAA